MSSQDRNGSVPSDGDDALERAWREASTERPPASVDAAVLAAARLSVPKREVTSQVGGGRPRSKPWLARWQPVLAAAAVAGLALVLVPMLPRDHGSAPTMQRQESTAAPTVESAPRSSPMPEGSVLTRPATQPPAEIVTERRERAVPAPPPSPVPGDAPFTPALSAVPAQAADSATPAPAPGSPSRAAEASSGERAATADAAATFGQVAPPSQEAATWAARIEALHAAGAIDAAARELQAFRAVDPQADAYLPKSLRAWARTVEPFPRDPGRE